MACSGSALRWVNADVLSLPSSFNRATVATGRPLKSCVQKDWIMVALQKPYITPKPQLSHNLNIFERVGWLAGQSEGFRDRVIAASRVCQAPARHLIFAAGDPPGGIFGVVRGGFGVYITSPDHLPRLAHIYRDGRWFGFGPMVGDAERNISITAMEDSVYLHVPLLAIETILAEDPEAPLRLARLSNEKVTNVMRIACDLMIADTARRLAAVLLRVTAADDNLDPVDPEGFHITQLDLAEMANASRPYVNKVLKDFVDRGWIRKSYNCIRILQPAQLHHLAFDD